MSGPEGRGTASWLFLKPGTDPAAVPEIVVPVTSPRHVPSRGVKPKPLGSLVASAQRLTSESLRGKHGTTVAKSWQEDAWDMFDLVGEQRFLANTLAGRLAQARLFVGLVDPERPADDPIQCEDAVINGVLTAVGGSAPQRAQMIERLGVNLFVAGDGWLVGIPKRLVPGTPEYREALAVRRNETFYAPIDPRTAVGLEELSISDLDWRMLSVSEVSSSATGLVTIRIGEGMDDKIEAKYLNTTETPLYKKSTVLYGLDSAKKAMAAQRQAVVVEGYTDVMAAHLAGVQTAVATCGTAFGIEHIKVLRRIMRDEADLEPARVIFTFDGDAAGQSAAMKAFKEDQRWMSQSFVAVAPGGKDPCELRQSDGDAAVRALVDDAVPMFEFAVRTTVHRFDLDRAEGRVQAATAIAPILLGIRDAKLAMQYKAKAAGLIGFVPEELDPYLKEAKRRPAPAVRATDAGQSASQRPVPGSREANDPNDPHEESLEPTDAELAAALPPPNLRDPAVQAERQLLQCLLQYPDVVDPLDLPLLQVTDFTAAAHQAVFATVAGVGLPGPQTTPAAWHTALAQAAPMAIHAMLAELAVAPLPVLLDPMTGSPATRYVDSLITRIREAALSSQTCT